MSQLARWANNTAYEWKKQAVDSALIRMFGEIRFIVNQNAIKKEKNERERDARIYEAALNEVSYRAKGIIHEWDIFWNGLTSHSKHIVTIQDWVNGSTKCTTKEVIHIRNDVRKAA
jgi:hypothetical protein